MPYLGETIALGVAVSWTVTAMCIEYASRRIGSLAVNLLRLVLAFVMSGLLMLAATGSFVPPATDADTWLWLSVSGAIGFLFGDFCLFYSYVVMGSRFGQLFMTLAPIAAAAAGYAVLGERIGPAALAGMALTIGGIGMSVMSRSGHDRRLHFKLPVRGVLLGIGAGVGQGVGLVFSKLGMMHYSASLTASGIDPDNWIVPFGASQMRMAVAIVGFTAVLALTGRIGSLRRGLTDRRAAVSIVLGTVFGPFLGVAFSLMAVRYTSSGVASTIMALTPVIILAPAVAMGQRVTAAEAAGAVVSVAGVALFFV